MPRAARLKSSGAALYHIIERGNGRQPIFREDEDRWRLLATIQLNQKKYGFSIYAFCLMTNHLHLLLACDGVDISQVMKSINVSYAIYFNRKYEHSGHLFQDRFKSELIDTTEYAMEVSRYIHLNPLKAGIIGYDGIHKYIWSSCPQYLSAKYKGSMPVDTSFILGLFADDAEIGRVRYREYLMRENVSDFSKEPLDAKTQLSAVNDGAVNTNPEDLLQAMAAVAGVSIENIRERRCESIELRNNIICQLRRQTALSLKEIGQMMGGLSESMVSKIVKEYSSQEPSLCNFNKEILG